MQKQKTAKKLMSFMLAFALLMALFVFVPAPVGAAGEVFFTASSGGNGFSMAIAYDGSLWAWGRNDYCQLGDGTKNERREPIKIMDSGMAQVSASLYYSMDHVMGVKKDGSLLEWGYSRQLANGSTLTRETPTEIMSGVAQVSLGDRYTMVIKTDGSLWAWGNNNFGQIGDGSVEYAYQPKKIIDSGVAQVSAGDSHVVAIKTDGSLLAWGGDLFGSGGLVLQPTQIMDGGVAQVSAGSGYVMAIMDDGSLWGWGKNNAGQIGAPDNWNHYYQPTQIMDGGVAQVSAGVDHTMAVMDDGSLWGWGNNNFGQIGDGSRMSEYTRIPTKIMDGGVAQVSAGADHTVAVMDDGSIWTWGSDNHGQLGGTQAWVNGIFTPLKIIFERAETPIIGQTDTEANGKRITIETATSGATIYYTTNGSTPTAESGTLYEGPFELSDMTISLNFITKINAIAVKSGIKSSDVASEELTRKLSYYVNISSIGEGASKSGYNTQDKLVEIEAGAAPAGTKFKYWITADKGVDFADAYSENTSFFMPANSVEVIAIFEDLEQVAMPEITQKAIFGGKKITIETATPGATIYYTKNGSPPTTSSERYSAPFDLEVASHMTIKAIAVKSGMADSEIAIELLAPNATYKATLSSPGAGSTGGGSYEEGAVVSIEAGTAPEGKEFKNWKATGPGVSFADANAEKTSFAMPANDVTVTAVFEDLEQVAMPTITQKEIAGGKKVTIETATPGATIYYTENGSSPTTSSKRYSAPFDLDVASDITIKAMAVKSGMADSEAAIAVITANATYTVTVSSPGAGSTGGGSYEEGAAVSIKAGTAPTGKEFKNWTATGAEVSFADANAANTSFSMPKNDLTVTAIFEEIQNIYNLGEETYSFENYGDSHSAGGHCFGMSSTSSGYYLGILDMAIIGGGDNRSLYSFGFTSTVKAPICHYQDIQGSFSLGSTVAGGSTYKTGVANIASDWPEVVNYVKSHDYDGKGMLQIGFRRDSEGGHAINFLYYSEVGGQPRIYAYDNNFPHTETYFYKDAQGNVRQAPYSTFSGSIDCIALRDVSTYFSLAGNFDATRVIYADKGAISVEDASAYAMDGAIEQGEYVVYEVPAHMNEVMIVPLIDDAVFEYLDKTYSFGKIGDDTVGLLTLATPNEGALPQNPVFTIMQNDEIEETYEITATAGTGGTVSGGGTFAPETQVTLTATPDDDHTFDGWYENGEKISEAGATYTFVATANREIEARFAHTPDEDPENSMDNFFKKRTYDRGMFTDVNENEWYGYNQGKNVANAYEYALMSGYPGNTFQPAGSLTIAEAITIAARVHSIYHVGTDDIGQSETWYEVYVDYAISKGMIKYGDFADYEKAATRAQMAYIFSRALPESEFGEINAVTSLPDVDSGTAYSGAILALYRAGVLTGNDEAGTFLPENNISRAEAAAIITRVILPSTRIKKTFNAGNTGNNGSSEPDTADRGSSSGGGVTMATDKTVYAAYTPMKISLTGVTAEMDDNAWVTIEKPGTPAYSYGTAGVDYKYVRQGSSTVELTAPAEEGEYELRFYKASWTNEENFIESLTIRFTVSGITVTMTTDKTTYAAGAKVTISLTGVTAAMDDNAWVTIEKPGTPADSYGSAGVGYKYVRQGSSTVELTAPAEEGEYELRFYKASRASVENFIEILTIRFTVSG